MGDEDLKKIGDEIARVLEPVNEWQDKVDKKLDRIDRTLDEHTDKIDALTVEVHDLHQELGAFKDKTISEIYKVKEHVGLPTIINP